MKQTAVEWLVEQMSKEEITFTGLRAYIKFPELIQQAKEMEKNQNKYFYDHGFYTGRCTHNDKDESFEYFFNSDKLQ
jgi:hypothetical protein